ncbi:hypothetical protein ASG82_14705 [Mycobacterium sp. Soil538]|nr:hypothetical protein ASG82_14705 [Mycobacterium sp. Soil538]
MANSLLDFVMSLVRDPDAAARYAADPAQALADAHLTDVTSVDVQNLIPVVAESLSMSAPAHGLDAFGAEPVSNVWASGAATSAFDAFDDHVPLASVIDTDSAVPTIVDHLDEPPAALAAPDPAPSLQVDDVDFDQPAINEASVDDHWAPMADDVHSLDHPVDHGPGFDLFD